MVAEKKHGLHSPLSEFRQVTMHYEKGRSVSYLVHESETELMVEAQKKLHYSPGVNPHNGVRTSRIREITIDPFHRTGPFWWTGPGLGVKGESTEGATLMQVYDRRTAWRSPEYQAELDREARQEIEMEASHS